MVEEHIVYGPKPLIPISTDSSGLIFYNHFKNNPDVVAMSDSTRNIVIKNKAVLRISCLLAIKLKQYDLDENDVIGICTPNEVEVLYITLASLYLGNTVTCFNPRYTNHEMTNCVKISNPKIVFCTDSSADFFSNTLGIKKVVIVNGSTPTSKYESFETFIASKVNEADLEQFHPVSVDVNDKVAFILYSSGTTGLPKGVCLTHKNVNTLIAFNEDPRLQPFYSGKASLGILPFFHAAGLFVMLFNLLRNNEVVILKSFEPELFLKTIQDKKIEFIQGVPTIANFLAKSPLVTKYNICLKYITIGSGSLNPDIARKLIDRFQLKILFQKFGMTELSCGATTPTVTNNKFGSCGQLYPYMMSKVVDPDTGRTLGPYKSGELYFKGPKL
ncbi:hypothetical protein FQR65_LT07613 [Abscondita terminalis]|nr:hypothetical protein FQR65_LT07613 [Abscondita terminalis]